MRAKTLAVVMVAASLAGTMAACGSGSSSSPPAPTVGAPGPTSPDFTSYVSGVTCNLPSSDSGFAGQQDTVHIQFTLTNRSSAPLRFDLTFAVKDRTSAQVATFGVDYGIISGPLAPGAVAKYDDYHGMATGHLPAGPFSCSLTDVSVS
jgi:hypothetical protein